MHKIIFVNIFIKTGLVVVNIAYYYRSIEANNGIWLSNYSTNKPNKKGSINMSKKVEVNEDSVFIAGVEYVPKSEAKSLEIDLSNLVLIRTYSAGVHFGTLEEHDRSTNHVVLTNARRIYQWSGACSLSQVAIDGVDLNNSKISIVIPKITLGRAIEIIPMSINSATQLFEAEEWKK